MAAVSTLASLSDSVGVRIGLWIVAGLTFAVLVLDLTRNTRPVRPALDYFGVWPADSDHGVDQLRATLSDLQSEGQALRAELNSIARQEAGSLQTPCERWAETVVRELKRGGEGFRVVHFLDEQPHGDTFYSGQNADYARVDHWMQRRLSRLGEIVRDL